MTLVLLLVFLASAATLVIWGAAKPERHYQFPMLFGVVWLLYIGPMAVGLAINGQWIPPAARQDGGLEMALIVATLCIWCGYFGYIGVRRAPQPPRSSYCDQRFFIAAVVLIAIAYLAFFKLALLSGGILRYFSVHGSYRLQWQGLPVAYAFFIDLIYPGLVLALFALLHRATPARIAVVLAAVALPLADILLRGRRGELVTLGLVLLLTLYFRRLWAPRVRTLMAAMLLGAVVVVVAPDYRQHSQLGADHGELLRIEVLGAVSDIVTGREPTELVYAAVQLPATLRADEYGWGRGLYNRFVQDAIPSLLVGREVKVSLFVPAPDFLLHTLRYYNWQAPVGWIPTAPTDVFRVAGFLGPLLFAGFGALFRLLWLRTGSSVGAQALYIVVAPMAMQSVTVGVSHLVAPMFFTVVFMLPALLWAQRPLGEDMDHRSADGGRHADCSRAV